MPIPTAAPSFAPPAAQRSSRERERLDAAAQEFIRLILAFTHEGPAQEAALVQAHHAWHHAIEAL